MISMTEKEMTAYAAGTRCRRKPIVPQITKATAEKLGLTPGCEVIFHYTVRRGKKNCGKYGKGGREP